MTLEEEKLTLVEKLEKWKKEKNYSPEELKLLINQIKDPVTQLIAKKILLKEDN